MCYPIDSSVPHSLCSNLERSFTQHPPKRFPELHRVLQILLTSLVEIKLYPGTPDEITRCVKLLNADNLPNADQAAERQTYSSLMDLVENIDQKVRKLGVQENPLIPCNLDDALSSCDDEGKCPDLDNVINWSGYFLRDANLGSRHWEVWHSVFGRHFPVSKRSIEQKRALLDLAAICEAQCARCGPLADQMIQSIFQAKEWDHFVNQLDQFDPRDLPNASGQTSEGTQPEPLDLKLFVELIKVSEFFEKRDFVGELIEKNLSNAWKLALTTQQIKEAVQFSEGISFDFLKYKERVQQWDKASKKYYRGMMQQLFELDHTISPNRLQSVTKIVDSLKETMQTQYIQLERFSLQTRVPVQLLNELRKNQVHNALNHNFFNFFHHYIQVVNNLKLDVIDFELFDRVILPKLSTLISPIDSGLIYGDNILEDPKPFLAVLERLNRSKAYFVKSQSSADRLRLDVRQHLNRVLKQLDPETLRKVFDKKRAFEKFRKFLISNLTPYLPLSALRLVLEQIDLSAIGPTFFAKTLTPWRIAMNELDFPDPEIKQATFQQLRLAYTPALARWFTAHAPLDDENFAEFQHLALDEQNLEIATHTFFPYLDHFIDRGSTFQFFLSNGQFISVHTLFTTLQRGEATDRGIFIYAMHKSEVCFSRSFLNLPASFEVAHKEVGKVLDNIEAQALQHSGVDEVASSRVTFEVDTQFEVKIDEFRARIGLECDQTPSWNLLIHPMDNCATVL